MSIASWISPPHSFKVFPISRACSRTRSSLCSIKSRPMLPIIWPRVGAGVADHDGNAACAASSAALTSSLVDKGNAPRISAKRAGLRDSKVAPSLDSSNWPSMMLNPFTLGRLFGLLASRNVRPASSTWTMMPSSSIPSMKATIQSHEILTGFS